MDAGEAIFLNDPLGDQDGVFKVVTIPRHKGDAHVLTQRQLTHVHGGTIGQNVAASDNITDVNDRPLVDAGVLVGAGVLDQVIDVDTGLASGNRSEERRVGKV